MSETWKPIPGYEGYYEASDLGRIRSVDRDIHVVSSRTCPYSIRCKGKVLKAFVRDDRHRVTLWVDHKYRVELVGTLVMEAFVGARPAGLYVCHENGRAGDNRLANLYYGTPKQNSADAARHGTTRRGESIPWAKLTEEKVRYIRRNAGRMSRKELAQRTGTNTSRVGKIIRGEQWGHVS